MRCGRTLFILVLLSACREQHERPGLATPPSSASVALSPDAAPVSPGRVVCAPMQGPTRAPHDVSDGSLASSSDGKVSLFLEPREDHSRFVVLRARSGPTRTTKLPAIGQEVPDIVFRSANVIGFGKTKPTFGVASGYVVWATLRPLAVFARRAESSVAGAGSRVYFSDDACGLHAMNLDTGSERASAGKACSWFRVWGDLIALGKPTNRVPRVGDLHRLRRTGHRS